MRVQLKNLIIPSIPFAVLLVISCLIVWLTAFVGARYSTVSTQYTTISEGLQLIFSPNSLLINLVCIALTLFNAFLLAQINNRFTIIRSRTFLPILIFLLLLGTWNQTHIMIASHISLALFMLALFYFFSMVRDRKASEEAFMGSFLISLSSLMINPLIFIIPVCWIGFMMFQSFSLRTFLASIFGMLSPWILYLSVAYMLQPDLVFSQVFNLNINSDLSIYSFSKAEIIYTAVVGIIGIMSIFGMYSITIGDAINTRNKLNFLVFLLISTLILAVIFRNQFISFLPLIALIYSMLISHPLTLKQNNYYGILFLIFCLINIAFVISKYFIF
jgi:hypothetical protein